MAENILLRERRKLRETMKQQYMREIYHPDAINQTGVKFDPAVQRFMAMRASTYEHFKPTNPKNIFWLFALYIVPLGSMYYCLKNTQDAKEHKLSTGQVSYRDRHFKFF